MSPLVLDVLPIGFGIFAIFADSERCNALLPYLTYTLPWMPVANSGFAILFIKRYRRTVLDILGMLCCSFCGRVSSTSNSSNNIVSPFVKQTHDLISSFR